MCQWYREKLNEEDRRKGRQAVPVGIVRHDLPQKKHHEVQKPMTVTFQKGTG
jgi:hypothetical protein